MGISITEISAAVRRVTGPGKIELQKPSIGQAEFDSVADCLRGDVTSYSHLDLFQAKVAAACGTEYALCTSSGTAALHLALLISGVQQFTEVLVPALTFVGTANAVRHCGAFPNFVDVGQNFNVNAYKLGRYLERTAEKRSDGTFNRQTGKRITAIIVVDLLGMPADMDAIKEHAAKWGLAVIEDAAQALGSAYKGKPCGGNGHIGIVSFNNNKIITTNGGGALLTNDPFVQAKAWELATTARVNHPWLMNHTAVAWNYRMGNINAALGLPQLERLDDLVEQKARLHEAYAAELGLTCKFEGDASSRSNHWLNAILLEPLDHRRDEVLAALHGEGVACRTLFSPLHELPMYRDCPRDNLDYAKDVWCRVICLPSSPHLAGRL